MNVRKLSSAAIVAALAVGTLATTTNAFAAEEVKSSLDSTGTVRVLEDDGSEGPGDPFDPENPGIVLPPVDPGTDPEIETNPESGPLMIEKVSNLAFGEIMTSANRVETYAAPVTLADGTTRGNFIQWRDTRAGGVFGYELQAELTSQFTGSNPDNTLRGATIGFSNGFVAADERDGENEHTAPSTVASSFTLAADGNAQEVVLADGEYEEGKGRYIMAFGHSRDENTDSSVKLSIPANTAANMAEDDYQATVTWRLVSAPTGETGNAEGI
ncbi:WxL domain-containing protein [Enterococcus casseliflavus]|nr:WxL domain-containing protein [Enterococcus casseliflavus]